MSNFLILLRQQIFLKFRSDKENKRFNAVTITLMVLFFLLYLPMMAVMCVGLYFITPMAVKNNALQAIITFIITASQIIVIFFGVSSLITTLYMSKDNEILMGLPLSKGTIFLSKLTFIYLGELFFSLIMTVPTLLTLGITANLGFLFFLRFLLIIFLIPLVPLIIASILAIPVMYIITFFKNKGVASTIGILILVVLLFGGYLFGIGSLSIGSGSVTDPTDMESFLASILENLKITAKYQYPNIFMAEFLCGINTLVNFFIILAVFLVSIVIVYFLAMLTYNKTLSSGLIVSKGNNKSKVTFKETSTIKALVKKDFSQIIRTPGMAYYILSVVVLSPLLIAFYGIIFSNGNDGLNFNMSAMMSMMLFQMFGGMNYLSIAPFSIESDGMTYNKSLPLSGEEIVKGKLVASNILTYITIVISAVVMIIMKSYFFSFFDIIMLVVLDFFLFEIFNMFSIKKDLKQPNFTWTTPKELFKGNKNLMIVLISLGLAVVYAVVMLLLALLSSSIGVWIYYVVNVILILIVFAVDFSMKKSFYRDVNKLMFFMEI